MVALVAAVIAGLATGITLLGVFMIFMSPVTSQTDLVWVELYPVGCIENQIGLKSMCWFDFLAGYYNNTVGNEPSMRIMQGANFENTTIYLIDYFDKRGIEIHDVNYALVNRSLCEAGECFDHYVVKVLVSNRDVQTMLDLGYELSALQDQLG